MRFNEVTITTTTITAAIDGIVDRHIIYCILPLYITDYKAQKTPRSHSVILPVYEQPNKIILIKKDDQYRCQYKIKAGCFPHGVEVVISTGHNNMNIRIYPESIQATGVKNMEIAKACVKYIFTLIKKLQERLIIMNEDKEKTLEVYKWLETETRGRLDTNGRYILNKPKDPKKCFEGNELLIAKLFVKYIAEGRLPKNKYQDIYLNRIRWMMKVTFLCRGSLTNKGLNIQMRNYSYNVGFYIDKKKTRDVFIAEKSEYIYSRYDNMIDNCVEIRIQHPSTSNPGHNGYFHTFRIHTSGKVVQSSKIVGEAQDIFYLFVNIIKESKNKIKLKKRAFIE